MKFFLQFLITIIAFGAQAKPLSQLIYEDIKGKCDPVSTQDQWQAEAIFCPVCESQKTSPTVPERPSEILEKSFFVEIAKTEKAKAQCNINQIEAISKDSALSDSLLKATCQKFGLISDVEKNISYSDDLLKTYKSVNDRSLRRVPEKEFEENTKVIDLLKERSSRYAGMRYLVEANDILIGDPNVREYIYKQARNQKNEKQICEGLKKELNSLLEKTKKDLSRLKEILSKAIVTQAFDENLKSDLWSSAGAQEVIDQIAKNDSNLSQKITCQMDSRYGKGAELLSKFTILASSSIGFGLSAFGKLGAALLAARAKTSLTVARVAFVSELLLATKININSLEKACFLDHLPILNREKKKCENLDSDEVKNFIYENKESGNCLLQASLATASAIVGTVGVASMFPKKIATQVQSANLQTTNEISELKDAIAAPAQLKTLELAQVRPNLYADAFAKSKEYQNLRPDIRNAISMDPKPFQYADDVAAAGSAKSAFVIGGKNSNEVIEKMPTLTGVRLEKLDLRAKGWRTDGNSRDIKGAFEGPFADSLTFRISGEGFLAKGTGMRSQLLKDNGLVQALGLDHQKVAEPLIKIMKYVESNTPLPNSPFPGTIKDVIVKINGKSYNVDVHPLPGGGNLFAKMGLSGGWRSSELSTTQGSLFNDSLFSNYALTIRNSSGQVLKADALTPQFIHRYGFYQGGEYRVDPLKILEFFRAK